MLLKKGTKVRISQKGYETYLDEYRSVLHPFDIIGEISSVVQGRNFPYMVIWMHGEVLRDSDTYRRDEIEAI